MLRRVLLISSNPPVWLAGALVAASLASCSTDSGANAYLPGGKADELSQYELNQCERDKLLDFVNACATGQAELESRGLVSNARTALLARRGSSCEPGGDRVFATLFDLDDVSQIGPARIRNMGETFAQQCSAASEQTASVFFSPRYYSQSHLPELVRQIDLASHHIDLALYSFNDGKVMDALKRAVGRGVKVRAIYFKARNAPTNGDSIGLEQRGVNVRYVASSKVMHHKFMIIDGPVEQFGPEDTATLITGSGNWTSNAAKIYDENMIVLKSFPSVVLAYQHEFNTIWDRSEDFVYGDPKPYELSPLPLDPETLPQNPDARAVFTMGNFDPDMPGFRRIWGRYTIANAIIEELQTATEYVYIASGHLRSKPIYEALVALKTARPEVDIRVYLDGQEYVADNDGNEEALQKCLNKSSVDTEQEIEECHLAGWKYAYSVDTVDTDGDGHGGDLKLRIKYYAYRWKHTYPQMHHKYLVIDGKTLITGSYNLSHNAETGSFENMVILRNTIPVVQGLIDAFEDNFLEIWNTDGDGALYDDLLTRIRNPELPTVPLHFKTPDPDDPDKSIWAPMALDIESITELKDAIREVYESAGARDKLDDCWASYASKCDRP